MPVLRRLRNQCLVRGRSSDSFRLRRLPGFHQWLKIVVTLCVRFRTGTYSSGNCCRLSRHSLLIGGGLKTFSEPLRDKGMKKLHENTRRQTINCLPPYGIIFFRRLLPSASAFSVAGLPGLFENLQGRRPKCLSLSSAITESSLFFSWLFRVDFTNDSGGNAADDRIVRHVFGNHRPCRDDGVVADGHALQDRGVRTDPDVPSERDRRRVGRLAVFGGKAVVERGEDDVVSDLAVVADGYASVVLEVAAGIDEYTAADADFFPKSE